MTPAERWRREQRAKRDAKILALRAARKTHSAIAAEMNISVGVVGGVCHRADPARSPRSKLPGIRRSISLPPEIARRMGELARETRTSFNHLCRVAAQQLLDGLAGDKQTPGATWARSNGPRRPGIRQSAAALSRPAANIATR